MVRADPPDRFRKPVENFGALVFLPNLRLVERETGLLPNRRRKLPELVERVNEPNQLASFKLFRHATYYVPKPACGAHTRAVTRTVAVPKSTSELSSQPPNAVIHSTAMSGG
jgi:hypothetical protein